MLDNFFRRSADHVSNSSCLERVNKKQNFGMVMPQAEAKGSA